MINKSIRLKKNSNGDDNFGFIPMHYTYIWILNCHIKNLYILPTTMNKNNEKYPEK